MTIPSWYPDELTTAGSEHLDPDYVRTYDDKAGTDPSEDLADLRLSPDDVLVDLGAGTGVFARAAARYCRKVVAVDVSEQMLDVVRRVCEEEDIPNIEIVRAGFLTYEHAGPPADAVYSRHALHHLPDVWKVIALGRILDMLRPGGVFLLRDLIYTLEPGDVDNAFERWFAGAAATPHAGWTRAELETHVREEFSPFSWLLEAMLERVGFEIERAIPHGSTYATYLCRKPA